ncbi:MAG: efflux RND transporter permease subunit [Deltaproteobacteria bacterium]|nr:efflux RND transporter permease subunit [Deltaproteobacteria bacterium]MCB9787436.1 efflux RND transporter permease subunit [Deltaproteobacteria bacterium]
MTLSDISIRRPVLATVMVGTLVVFGLAAYGDIGVDLFPNVEFPVVTVTAVYPGADPESVETKVVEKLEEAIGSVGGIDFMQATAQENVGTMVVQFQLGVSPDQAAQDMRDKIAAIQSDLPPDLEPPVVQKFDIGAAPVINLALGGPLPQRELTRLADDVVKARLQTLQDVGSVELVGDQEREFHVWLHPDGLEQYGLAASDVLQAIATQNVEIPGGRLQTGTRELTVKTRGQVHTAEQIGALIIPTPTSPPIRVRDVATVEDGAEEARSIASLNGQRAVALVVRKQSGTNTVEVAHRVHQAVEELRAELPPGVVLATPIDNSAFIEASISSVQFDLIFGGALAIFIILFFLRDWRATVISSLALPASVISTFALIGALDFTFNNMTMLALTLSIGILIDDAIVVIENIHRHLEMGKPPRQAAADATSEIGLAVMATTASIVAVFLPVAVMKGIVGRFFLQFGLTVVFAVVVSLFVAFTITPAYSSRLLRAQHGKPTFIGRGIDWLLNGIDSAYRVLLGGALRHKVLTLLVAVGVFAGSIVLAAQVPGEFLPAEDRDQFIVRVELPTGTDLAATEAYIGQVADQIREVPGVVQTFSTIGGGSQGEVNSATIQVNTLPKEERAFTMTDAMEHVRAMLASRQDAIFAVEKINAVGGDSAFKSAEIQYNIRGQDLEELQAAAAALIAKMKEAGGFTDLDTSFRGGKPEVQVEIDREQAADLGVPIAQVASTLRTYFAGEKVSEVLTPTGRFDVRARVDEDHRRGGADILGLSVRSARGDLVSLDQIVRVHEGEGPGRITRQDRQRQVTVYANLEGKALGAAVAEVDKLAAEAVPAHLSRDWAGSADMMTESMGYMGEALILAIVLVYLILAAQFESFIHPFTIMFSLPLAVTGAFGALVIAGMTLNIFTMIGFIMLMGLVTKNAILLVDYTNTLRAQGRTRREALLEAGPVRLRPILMTTLAMIFGMIPVAISQEVGAEQRAPMAVAVIGGLISSTLLTLVVVPVVYELLDRVSEFVTRKRETPTAQPAAESV